MSHYLPPQVMAFFAPRPPLPFVAPIEKTKPAGYEGVAPYMAKLRGEAPAASEAAPTDAASDPVVDAPCAAAMLTPSERAALAAGAKEEENAARLAVALESCTLPLFVSDSLSHFSAAPTLTPVCRFFSACLLSL
jgi:hypothetical protein